MNVAIRSKSLDILSICTGGGGLDLGIELAVPGARSVCMVEREAYAVAQLVSAMEAGHLAPAPIWSDARTFNGRAWRGAVDGLIGGIPCQPHSLAGKRGGQEDERDLWSTARRIIVQSRAWFVLIENVRGMLGGAERVWRDLLRLGFTPEGGLFTASECGLPQERERLFILAVADRNSQYDDGPWVKRAGWRRQSSDRCVEMVDAISQRGCSRNSGWEDAANADPASETVLGSVDNTVSRGWTARRGDNGADVRNKPNPTGEFHLAHSTCGEQRGPRERRAGPGPNELPTGRHGGRVPLFPPGPGDIDGWREVLIAAPELEPAFRRVADGLASRLDIARVDRLRLLGNGVVSLEGAYAFRTLVTRLAARGSAGAARIVRMIN